MPTRPKPSSKSVPVTKGSAKTTAKRASSSAKPASRAAVKTTVKAASTKAGAKAAPKAAAPAKKAATKTATAAKRPAAKVASPVSRAKATTAAAPAAAPVKRRPAPKGAPAAPPAVTATLPDVEVEARQPVLVAEPVAANAVVEAAPVAPATAAPVAAAPDVPEAPTGEEAVIADADVAAATPTAPRQVMVTVIPSEPPASSRPPREPSDEPHPELGAEQWYQREKARRTKPLTNDLMAEARELLLQAVAEAGPRRGRPVRVGAAAKPKPKTRAADDFDLDEYRPGEKKTT